MRPYWRQPRPSTWFAMAVFLVSFAFWLTQPQPESPTRYPDLSWVIVTTTTEAPPSSAPSETMPSDTLPPDTAPPDTAPPVTEPTTDVTTETPDSSVTTSTLAP